MIRLVILDPGCGWLTSNQREHWAPRSERTAQWVQAAAWTAKRDRLPMLDRAHIEAQIRFRTSARRDPANWHPTVKACIDGIVREAGLLLPDDDAAHLDGPDLRVGEPLPWGARLRVELHITPLPANGDPK